MVERMRSEASENVTLLVCGSRDWSDGDCITEWLDAFTGAYRVRLIEGGARGADAFAAAYDRSRLGSHAQFPAEWERYGKRAGPVRNAIMRDGLDYWRREGWGTFVLAFKEDFGLIDGKGGTEGMVKLAREAGHRGRVIRRCGPVSLPTRAELWPEN